MAWPSEYEIAGQIIAVPAVVFVFWLAVVLFGVW